MLDVSFLPSHCPRDCSFHLAHKPSTPVTPGTCPVCLTLCSNLLILFSEMVFNLILSPQSSKDLFSCPFCQVLFPKIIFPYYLFKWLLHPSHPYFVSIVLCGLFWFVWGSTGDWTWDLVHAGLLLCPWAIPLALFSIELNSYNVLIWFSIYLDCFSDFRLKSKLHKKKRVSFMRVEFYWISYLMLLYLLLHFSVCINNSIENLMYASWVFFLFYFCSQWI